MVLSYIVLHDFVVAVGVNPDIRIMGKTEVHDAAEYTMNIGKTGYAMDYMVRAFIIKPIAFIDLGVCRFR